MDEAKVLSELQMAEINLAKVPNVQELQKEAADIIKNFRTSTQVKEKVASALDFIDKKADYELNEDNTTTVDTIIKEFGGLSIKKAGIIRIDGTEAFGINITPRDWKETRKLGLQAIMEETMRDIKRWANALQDNFQRRWTELNNSLDILDERLIQVDQLMDTVGLMREGCEQVEYPAKLWNSFVVPKEKLEDDFVAKLMKHINYLSTVMKFYEMEEIRYRNTLVKYFGSPKDNNLSVIGRQIPKVLDVRVRDDRDTENEFITMKSRPFAGDFALYGRALNPAWVKKNYLGEDSNALLLEGMLECGFEFEKDGKDIAKTSSTIQTLSLTQMFQLVNAVKEVIASIKRLNTEYNSLDFDKWTVKDNLDALKRDSETAETKVVEFQSLATDYQYGINTVRSEISSYLTVLASHMLTAVTLNLGCYDAE